MTQEASADGGFLAHILAQASGFCEIHYIVDFKQNHLNSPVLPR